MTTKSTTAMIRRNFTLQLQISDINNPFVKNPGEISTRVALDNQLLNVLPLRNNHKKAKAKIDEFDKEITLTVMHTEENNEVVLGK